jgi:hypothetical protein
MAIYMKKIVKEKPQAWIGIWVALGAALGVPIENIPVGVGLGACIGLLFFFMFYLKNKKNIN